MSEPGKKKKNKPEVIWLEIYLSNPDYQKVHIRIML